MIRVLEIFSIPGLPSAVVARCEWSVPPEVMQRAAGAPIHVATHVKTIAGELVLHDGPRSQAVDTNAGPQRIFVPISVPAAVGRYQVELDFVVEGQFWGSTIGFLPAITRLERLSNMDLAWVGSGDTAPIPLKTTGTNFRIPYESYGAGDTERAVEIPWVLSRYRNEQRVLDVGSANAEARYIEAALGLRIPDLISLDLVPCPRPLGRMLIGDVRSPPLQSESIDLIFAISVIEHVGRDNTVYLTSDRGPQDEEGDFASLRAFATLLRPKGRALISLPFGRFQDHGWFIQYDLARLERLTRCADLVVEEREFFEYRDAWRGPVAPETLADRAYKEHAAAAGAVVCLSLRKP